MINRNIELSASIQLAISTFCLEKQSSSCLESDSSIDGCEDQSSLSKASSKMTFGKSFGKKKKESVANVNNGFII